MSEQDTQRSLPPHTLSPSLSLSLSPSPSLSLAIIGGAAWRQSDIRTRSGINERARHTAVPLSPLHLSLSLPLSLSPSPSLSRDHRGSGMETKRYSDAEWDQ